MVFIAFFLGLISSYIGTMTPSMLNITATKISLEKGENSAKQFAIGVSVIVIFQAFFGLYFLTFIFENPIILNSIHKISIFIFAILSIAFFIKALQEQKEVVVKKSTKNPFLIGIGLSSINMFSIPFFCGVAAVFNMYDWLALEKYSILLFSFGSSIGTFLILYHYSILAEKLKPKIAKFTKYLNYILSVITGVAALAALLKII